MPSSDASEIYTLSLHDALPIFHHRALLDAVGSQRHFIFFGLGVARIGGDLVHGRGEDAAGLGAEIDFVGDRFGERQAADVDPFGRSEEHTSELQSRRDLVCRLLTPPRSTLFPYTTLFRSFITVRCSTRWAASAISYSSGWASHGSVAISSMGEAKTRPASGPK